MVMAVHPPPTPTPAPTAQGGASLRIKRGIDILVSASLLVLLSPLLIATALVIRLYDGGPAIYRQLRVGRAGRPFFLWKFRSMRPDADRIGSYKTVKGDPRITPVGHWLRRASVDELPQLVNVLRGDMSLVGPRPDTPAQLDSYTVAQASARLSVRPGLTGPAQIYHKRIVSDRSRLDWDLDYVNTRSNRGDLTLMFRTLTTVLRLQNH